MAESLGLLTDDDIFGSPASTGAGGLLSDADIFGEPQDAGPGIVDAIPGGRTVTETLKGVPEGAVSMGGATLKGAAGLQKGAQRSAAAFGRQQLAVMDRIDRGERVPETEDAIGYQHMTAQERRAARAELEAAQGAFDPGTVEESTLFRAGEGVQDFARTILPASPGYEDSTSRNIGRGIGSVAGGVALAAIGGPVAAGTAFSLAGSGESVDRAIQAGASEDEIVAAAKQGQFAGMSDSLPVETLLGRIPLPGGQFVKIPVAMVADALRVAQRIGFQALVEGIQEGGQEFVQNAIQRGYDEDQSLTEGVAEGAGLGAAVGGIVEAAMTPGRGRGARPAEQQARPEAVPEGAQPAELILGDEDIFPEAAPIAPEAAPGDTERAGSPRLTPEDRDSPIPNDLIDDGKALIEELTGKPAPAPETSPETTPENTISGTPAPEAQVPAGFHVMPDGSLMADAAMADTSQSAPADVTIPAAAPQETSVPAAENVTTLPADVTSPEAIPAPSGSISGEAIDGEWTRFTPESGTLEIPRADMPQIKAEHRGAMVNFLEARGVAHDEITVPATDLKPTQAEFSRKKVDKAKAFEGGDRAILVSSDGYVVDGHHQWMAKREAGEAIRAIRLDAPIRQLLSEVKGFPSATTADGRPTRGPITRSDIDTDVAVTSSGREVPVTYAVVEAGDLVPSQRDGGGSNPDYPAELQPRDRERAVSQSQIAQIAQNLNPRLLDRSPRASDGAPIIAEDGVVESGNGRVLAIRRAYQQGGADAYRQHLADQGYPVAGMKQPVLVRVRSGEMPAPERAAFTREANERDTLAMSATEQAMADAQAMSPSLVGIYRGGDIDQAGNRDFVRAFVRDVVNANDQARMVGADGALSQEAVRRVQAALLAKAYGDADLVAALVESTDTNIKAIGGALMDVAADWAQMRSEAQAGTISPDVDQTAKLLEAVRLVDRARRDGQKLRDLVAQKDIFSGQALAREAEAFLMLMFQNRQNWTQPVGRDRLAEALRFYAAEARKTTAGTDLLGETAASPSDILDLARKKQDDRREGTGQVQAGLALQPPAAGPAGQDAGPSGAGRAVEAEPRQQEGGGPQAARDRDRDAGEGQSRPVEGYGKTNTVFTEDAAAAARKLLRDKFRNQVGSGLDPEMVQAGITLAGYHIEAGARSFAAFSKAMLDDLGESAKPFLRSWYEGVRYYPGFDAEGMTAAAEIEAGATPSAPSVEPAPVRPSKIDGKAASIASDLRDRLIDPEGGFATIVQARKFLADNGWQPTNPDIANKEAEELIERAVVMAAREIVRGGRERGPSVVFDRLVGLYERQPRLASRTSQSMAEQAYSTPVPLAYVASRLANVSGGEIIYEPTAGNGALLIEADPKAQEVFANELNATRVESLRAQGFNVTQDDAMEVASPKSDRLIANPPFGAVRSGGRSTVFEIGDYSTTAIDQAIAMKTLERMDPEGRAVFIVGSVKEGDDAARSDGYNTSQKRKFYKRLYDNWNVVEHFTVSGDLYQRQGAGWPVDVIVIDGKGKSSLSLPAVRVPKVVTAWADLKGYLDGTGERDAGRAEGRAGAVPVAGGEQVPTAAGAGTRPQGDDSGSRTPAGSRRDGGEPARDGQPADRGAGAVRAEPADDGSVDAGSRGGPVAARDDAGRTGERVPAQPRESRLKTEANATGQSPYRAYSRKGEALGTLVPHALGASMDASLGRIESEHGDIDAYVAEALGYKQDDLPRVFSAEQIDAIALAISNVASGDAFIIGDQTGIGKGRVVAAAIRYAHRRGMVPVFVTEKPDLYGDMFRDLTDIEWGKSLGRDPDIFMTNAGATVPLDDEAVEWLSERDEARAAGQSLPARRGRFMPMQTSKNAEGRMGDILAGRFKPDVVFTTYDQMNSVKGEETNRRRFMDQIAGRAFLIMDESHNAGGQGAEASDRRKKGTPPPRAEKFREWVGKARSVMYSSATYAKNPKVMDLYSRTDMAKAVDDPKDLPALIEKGRVPLQQVVASMLADAGQYARRERSFEGVEYGLEVASVDQDSYAAFAGSIRSIYEFDRSIGEWRGEWIKEWLKENAAGQSMDGGIGDMAANSTEFASIMHNIVNQMLLAIKAEAAATKAVDALKAGEKPVVALSFTSESFIKDYAEDRGIAIGGDIDIDFRDVLRRYLERTMRITVKLSDDSKMHVQIPVDELPGEHREMYDRALRTVEEADVSAMPVSPIDWIRRRLAEEGFSVREVTGRSTMIDYAGKRLVARPSEEQGSAGKRVTIKKFNDGSLDAVILNRSGSTGVSLHASSKFKDKRRRRMILAQADPNIDTHMQMLGRVHRTGQVVAPAYTQLAADIPAEARPTAVLMKKMASLNANTTASRKSAFTADSVDFMNEYGDEAALQWARENPFVNARLGSPVKFDEKGKASTENPIQKLTGRIMLLKPAEQQELLDALTASYNSIVAQKEAMGENALEAKALDLQAEPVSAVEIRPSAGDSPFQAAAMLETMKVKSPGRAMKPKDVVAAIAKALGRPAPDANFARAIGDLAQHGKAWADGKVKAMWPEFKDYRRWVIEGLKVEESRQNQSTKLQEQMNHWQDVMAMAHPGAHVNLSTTGDDVRTIAAIVLDVESTGKAQSPVAGSAWNVTLAIPDMSRQLTIPFSQIALRGADSGSIRLSPPAWTDKIGNVEQMFEQASKEGKEERVIATGNILAAFDQLHGKGQIVQFTDADGNVKPGVLMPRGYSVEAFQKERRVRFQTAGQVLRFLTESEGKAVASEDDVIEVQNTYRGYVFTMPAARAKGGRYFTDDTVRAVFDSWNKRGADMTATVDRTTAERLIDAMGKIGARFAAPGEPDLAFEIVHGRKPDQQQTAGGVARFSLGEGAFLRRERAGGGIEVEYLLTEDFVGKAGDLAKRLRAALDRMNLADVGLRVSEKITASVGEETFPVDGQYFKGLIDIALDARDTDATLGHEAVHAMRGMGLFSETEWSVLSRKSKSEWLDRFDIADRYAMFPEWAQVEEGIAHAYGEWVAGKKFDGILVRSFKRIKAFIEALGNALRGMGFASADSIFQSVERGEVGARPRDRFGRFTRQFQAGDEFFTTEIVDTMDGPREQLVIPGAEKISDKARAERAMEGRMKPTKGQKDASGLPLFGDEKDQLALFEMRREPITAEDRQNVMQGFIRRGQPLDRAIRLPFAIFGGVDQEGQWKPGKHISDKAAKVITSAKFNPDGRLAWLNGTLETARNGLIDRYGLDPAYVDRDRKRSLDERRIMLEGAEFLKAIQERDIGPEEARVLQAVLTGEKVDDRDMQRLAVPIRQAIDEMGQEAVSLGLLSPESYERNRGAYLHRVYARHEADQNGLAKMAGKMMGRSRKKIIGDQFKGRGIFLEVEAPRLTKDDPEWREAKRGKPGKGEKFRILDRVQEDMAGGKAKVTDRVYWPADRAVPEQFSAYRDSGVWEIRGERGGKMVLWRDYTKAERENMGEIMDARYTIGKTYMLMAHDLATGRFYKDIAENGEWTRTSQPNTKWVNAADAGRLARDPEVEWVKVPDTDIPDSGGKKRWGALSDKWVRAEIWRDLNEIDIMSKPTAWRMLLTQWKKNKTGRSPVVHMNNVMSNVMFMDLADIRAQDLVAGLRSYANGDEHYQEAAENGAFGSDMMSQEIRDNVLKPILDEISKDMQGGAANSFLARAGAMGKFADRLWTWAKTADRFMLDAYRMEDEVFRMATYMRRREFGDSPKDAADFARQQFLDYDIRAPWVNAARNSVLPFISYTYRAVPLIARAIATRPWKLAKYFAIAYALNALAYAWDDESDEEKERASLREEEQGYTWLGVPRMLRMPFRSSDGLPVFLDIRRWIPAGDIFDTNQGSSAISIPAPIQFGGPLMMGAELALNKQGFTGEEITNELTDTWMEKAGKVGDYLWKSWMPSAAWVPGSWYWEKIGNAAKGATDSSGRPYDLPSAVSSSVGVKLKPQDVEQGLHWRGYELEKVERELKAQARRLGRQRERNLISQSEFEAGMRSIVEKGGRLEDKARELEEASR